jgi:hypothetical protein
MRGKTQRTFQQSFAIRWSKLVEVGRHIKSWLLPSPINNEQINHCVFDLTGNFKQERQVFSRPTTRYHKRKGNDFNHYSVLWVDGEGATNAISSTS